MSDTCEYVNPMLKWWQEKTCNYPWRNSKDLFHSLIAEILLQRTRRDVVKEVYNRFVKKYPDPKSLIKASREELDMLLRPLGLAKRIDYIIKLAKKLEEKNGKEKIRSYNDLLSLPGIGKYSASILSVIYFGEKRIAVDKNVARIIIRLYGIEKFNLKRPQDDEKIHELVLKCAPEGKYKEYNLALLDLGWEICKPRNPLCEKCPIKKHCNYYRKIVKKQ